MKVVALFPEELELLELDVVPDELELLVGVLVQPVKMMTAKIETEILAKLFFMGLV